MNKFTYLDGYFTPPFFTKWFLLLTAGLFLTFSTFGQILPTASETAKAITIGWNLGNTLEATGGETAWGNPLATQLLIDSVKAAGFNTIRIPCSWDLHANQANQVIDAAWFSRVKEVVDYCIKRNLYVILNIHWDGGWLEENCTEAKKIEVNEKQKAYWTQIANYFKTYDGHLLFASANEPNVENATQMGVLLSYHQTFINAVRATGGNNTTRVLIVQGPKTDIEKTNELMNVLPTDPTANRLMVEVHCYTPWNYCGLTEDADWGKMFYYWGKSFHSNVDPDRNPTWGEEATIDAHFNLMKTKFSDKGIPVIIGEFGVIKRTSLTGDALALHIASREYYYKYITETAKRFGLKLVYWDAGFLGNNSFTLFDRKTGTVLDKGALNALMNGAGIVTHTTSIEANAKIKIYPNPFSQSISISISDADQVSKISVYDLLGNQMEELVGTSVENTNMLGATLSVGTYLVKIYFAEKVHVFKINKM